jgi:hypothetical protein
LPYAQALTVAEKFVELDPEREGLTHWHFNDCGCCITLHGRDCAYVIGPDGGADFFPDRGCDCPDHGG